LVEARLGMSSLRACEGSDFLCRPFPAAASARSRTMAVDRLARFLSPSFSCSALPFSLYQLEKYKNSEIKKKKIEIERKEDTLDSM
jgi:hypothetical protein